MEILFNVKDIFKDIKITFNKTMKKKKNSGKTAFQK